jgi:hypothetical protein
MDKIPNGGFPPIVFCNKKDKTINKKVGKERLYIPDIKNINIKEILNTNTKIPLILNQEEKIEELNSI